MECLSTFTLAFHNLLGDYAPRIFQDRNLYRDLLMSSAEAKATL